MQPLGPHDGINALIIRGGDKEPLFLSLFLLLPLCVHMPRKAVWGHNQEEGPHQQADHAGTLTFRLWEINFCCLSHLVYGILLWHPELTHALGFRGQSVGCGIITGWLHPSTKSHSSCQMALSRCYPSWIHSFPLSLQTNRWWGLTLSLWFP